MFFDLKISYFPFRNDVKCYMQQARFLTVRCHFRQQQSSIWGSEKQIEIANEEKFFLWHGTSNHSSSSSQISYYVHEVFIVQLFCYYPIGNSDWKLKEVCQLQNLYWTFVIFEKCTWQILNFAGYMGCNKPTQTPTKLTKIPLVGYQGDLFLTD